jgi:transcriptional regulator with XRE-family HTH domain
MNIGERIKKRRKELKMTADDLGNRLGKDRSTIYRYEKGDIENLPLDILEPIAEALMTTPQYLMGWNEKIEEDPVGMAELHFEMIMDEDLNDIFDDFKTLDPAQKKIVKDLVHSLAATKKGSQ